MRPTVVQRAFRGCEALECGFWHLGFRQDTSMSPAARAMFHTRVALLESRGRECRYRERKYLNQRPASLGCEEVSVAGRPQHGRLWLAASSGLLKLRVHTR